MIGQRLHAYRYAYYSIAQNGDSKSVDPRNLHLTRDSLMEYNKGEQTTGDGVPSAHRGNCVRGGLAVTSFLLL